MIRDSVTSKIIVLLSWYQSTISIYSSQSEALVVGTALSWRCFLSIR